MWRSEYQIQRLCEFKYRSGMEMNMRSCPKGCVPDAASYEPYDAYDSYEPFVPKTSPRIPHKSPKRKKSVKKPSACTIHRFNPEQCDAQPNCKYVRSTKRRPYCTTKRQTSSNLYRSTNSLPERSAAEDGGEEEAAAATSGAAAASSSSALPAATEKHPMSDDESESWYDNATSVRKKPRDDSTTKREIKVEFDFVDYETTLVNLSDYTEITDVLRGKRPQTTEVITVGGYLMEFRAETTDERYIRYINERLYYIQKELVPTIISGIYQNSKKDYAHWFILPKSVVREYFDDQFEQSFSSLFSYEKDKNKILVSDNGGKHKIDTYNRPNDEPKTIKDISVENYIKQNLSLD